MSTVFHLLELILLTAILYQIIEQNNKGEENMASLKDRFDAIEAKLDEASSELTLELQNLRDALANAGTTLSPEAETSLANIEAKAEALADVVPNPAPPAPPVEDELSE